MTDAIELFNVSDEDLKEQANNSEGAPHLKPWQFQPGQSGNPKGRPKGSSMKEWVKTKLAEMNEDERLEFLKGMPKEIIWKMAEGTYAQDITSGGNPIIPIPIDDVRKNIGIPQDKKPDQEN